MATGTSKSIVLSITPPIPGPSSAPTIITAYSASGALVSTFDLEEKQKRWVVIGICLNRLLLPVLRKFVSQEISKHYLLLKSSSNIDKQVYSSHLKKDGSFNFNYGSINNNWGRFRKNARLYDYKVNIAEDFAKLYLEPHLAKFTGFDNTCDLSAVLGILVNASVFYVPDIHTSASDVRSKVRNKWGHCDFDHWTVSEFNYCFQLMETLIRALALPTADECKAMDDLQNWEKKGIKLCMGCPVDKDLMNLVSTEVTNLQQDVVQIKKTNSNEAKKINAAILCITDEIDNFIKRLSDIEGRIEIQRKEQLEKNERLTCATADVSNKLTQIEKRQDTSEQNIVQWSERQNNIETTVSSVVAHQENITFQVDKLDTRVKALEEGNFASLVKANIFQLPSRNPCFCGRDSELKAIASQRKDTACFTQSAISGLGGVGKTSLAVEYLWRYKEDYPGGIFWISGENNNLFQISVGMLARQIGTYEQEFSNSLSRTLDWLQRREKSWCLIVDNLDELELSTDMRKLLMGHWKQTACGHIIITTRREPTEVAEETRIEEQFCIDLKCMSEEEGIQFLCLRTSKSDGQETDMGELVRELDGLPLALDQAGAYIRCLRQSVKEYVKKYRKQKLLLLKKRKARLLVENTSTERLAVHTTWLLNFDHISRISEEMDLGQAPALFMQVSAFFGPDDIPYEVINDTLMDHDNENETCSSWDPVEIVHLLTKFSLFQRHGIDSFGVHRLVQEVIRNRIEDTQKERVLSRAVRVLHQALVNTRSPAEVCESFVEAAVFSVENPPSLHLWGRLASHATYLQEYLINFCTKHKEYVGKLLHREECVRLFNDAAIFFSVSQEKVKAQKLQKLKLNFLVDLENNSPDESSIMPPYFIDIPLKDRNFKLISHCMMQVIDESVAMTETESTKEIQEEADRLREQGNLAVKSKNFEEALKLYSKGIEAFAGDYRLFSNRALCHLKLEHPQEALNDCEKCLSLEPNNCKALQRKAWALCVLVQNGSKHLSGHAKAAAAVAVYFHPELGSDERFCRMFPEVQYKEILNEQQFAFVLMTRRNNETLLLRKGLYKLTGFTAVNDFQIVGLEQRVILTCTKNVRVCCCNCYFENIVLPKGNAPLLCNGKETFIHMNHCEISGGYASCEDFPECNGGLGCVTESLGKPPCDRTHNYGISESQSGVGGGPGVIISHGSSGYIENCSIHHCGGGGALVAGEYAKLVVTNCEVHKNHQAGLEARERGKLTASENRIFDNGYHGVLIGPDAGECDINGNKIFENAREGILAVSNKDKVVISSNDIHHNGPFGISLADNSRIVIKTNKIFANGFWGIIAQARTSAQISENIISGNKCGGIFIGVNYSGRVRLESNVVKDHSGPWLEFQSMKRSLPIGRIFQPIPDESFNSPFKESTLYTNPPILSGNKEFNNQEGMFYPKEVAERRLHSGCTYCHHDGVLVEKCSDCHIASYCNKECQVKHWRTHKVLCKALRSRYSVTVEMVRNFDDSGQISCQMFGSHLKGIGEGPKPKRNSCERFIVKIKTVTLNSHPLQLLRIYDKSLTINGYAQSPEIFSVILECGVLGQLEKFTSKKCYFWAMFADEGNKLRIFLDHLAVYQEW